tara:strand:+ start:164 stop:628 length:465 start_codon:yes stop_codon:yes gene_type:complete
MGLIDRINSKLIGENTPVTIFFLESMDVRKKNTSLHYIKFLEENSLITLFKIIHESGCPSMKNIVNSFLEHEKQPDQDKDFNYSDLIKGCVSGNYKAGSDLSIRFINVDAGINIDIMSIECDINTRFKYINNVPEDIISMCGMRVQTIYGEIQV